MCWATIISRGWWSNVMWKSTRTKQIVASLHRLSHRSNYCCEPVPKWYAQHLVTKIKRNICFCVSRKKKKKSTKCLSKMSFFALLGVHMTITRIKLKTEQYMSFAQSWETRVNHVQWGFRDSKHSFRRDRKHSSIFKGFEKAILTF